MRILESTAGFKKDPKRPLVLALGNFDGIHRGHQKLLDYVVSQAKRLGGKAAVFTFREHPQAVLHPHHVPENLQSLDQKLNFFKKHRIEVCFLQHFDRRFSTLSAEEFIKKILVRRLGIREICLGYNARFGKGRAGDAGLLRKQGPHFGFDVFQAKPVVWRGSPISSTAIRAAIRKGQVDFAADLLGRSWSLEGKVVRGKARGKKLGFPTANVDLNGYVRPAFGVYAVEAKIISGMNGKSEKYFKGVANFGLRPTFGGSKKPVLETHLFNFKNNIYEKKIEVFFLCRLRGEKKFSSSSKLEKQIQKDIQAAKLVFKRK